MIKLTTKLLNQDLIQLGITDQHGIAVPVYINPNHIISFCPYPTEEGNEFKGTKIDTQLGAIIVSEDVDTVYKMLNRQTEAGDYKGLIRSTHEALAKQPESSGTYDIYKAICEYLYR